MDLHSIFLMAGGLALFIFGMQRLGEGLQKVAGEKLRRILQLLTGNPIMGILVGTVVTVLLQSSSATTVMVVGFVSAGLMTLPQAISVIMGANIGTTATAWIVSINISHYAWLFVAVGFVLMFIVKKREHVRYIGQVIMSFGLLFVGLNSMGDAMKPLAQSEEFRQLLLSIKDVPVLGVVVGTIATIVIQSSSASIGVLQSLSSIAVDDIGTPVVSLYQAIPILMGSNIGTTITAILAAIGAKRVAKRAALAHSIFNITGSVLFMFILVPFTRIVEYVLLFTGITLIPDTVSNISNLMTPVASNMMTSIAISHSTFNLINTLVWLPLIPLMIKLIHLIFPGEEMPDVRLVRFLDYKVVSNPLVAMRLVSQEVTRMTDIAQQMLAKARNMLLSNDLSAAEEIDELEETLDFLENQTVKYLSTIFSQSTTTESYSARVAAMMHATNDIERIGDYACNVIGAVRHMQENKLQFSTQAATDLDEAFSRIERMVSDSARALSDDDMELARQITDQEEEIDQLEDRLRISHLDRLNAGLCSPQATVIFLELIHIVERVSDHCKNLADVVSRGSHYEIHKVSEDVINT